MTAVLVWLVAAFLAIQFGAMVANVEGMIRAARIHRTFCDDPTCRRGTVEDVTLFRLVGEELGILTMVGIVLTLWWRVYLA